MAGNGISRRSLLAGAAVAGGGLAAGTLLGTRLTQASTPISSSVELSAESRTNESWCYLKINASVSDGERVYVEQRGAVGSDTYSFAEDGEGMQSLGRGSTIRAYAISTDGTRSKRLGKWTATDQCGLQRADANK